MKNNNVYIETMGCQMNKLDSELVIGNLIRRGYCVTDDRDTADVIIFNTCSVRAHAEDKVISKIGQLKRRHQEKHDFILAVIGCMAQRRGQSLLDEYRQVDIVCAPGQIHHLVDMITKAQQHNARVISLNTSEQHDLKALDNLDAARSVTGRSRPFSAYVRVMRGCNKYCHYCVVPYVRGNEWSRPLDHIVAESRRLVDHGVKEITLLGQTVNSYKYTANNKTLGLADVLYAVHEIAGIERLRFVTSYPADFDKRIFTAMAELPKVCEYLHICAQSGSDRILKAMNRRYTAKQYLELIGQARQMVPGITIAGDFIVGYPGEDDQDFQATKSLVRNAHYKNCFIFKYSARPGTMADKRLADNIGDDIKKARNIELLNLQNEIATQDNQQLIGKIFDIMVEGPSKKPHLNNTLAANADSRFDANDECSATRADIQLVGRTRGDQIVVFPGCPLLAGEIVNVKIARASALTLFGEIVA